MKPRLRRLKVIRTFRRALCVVIASIAIALPMAPASATEPLVESAEVRTSAATELGAETVEGPEAPVSELLPPEEPEKTVSNHADAKDWLSTAMNLGAIAFLIWMAALLWRPGLGRSLSDSKS